MKRIRLLEVLSDEPGIPALDERLHLLNIARAPQEQSSGPGHVPTMDHEEMHKSVRVMKALKAIKTGDVLELEDADHEFLCAKLRVARWYGADERTYALVEKVYKAEEHAPDEDGLIQPHLNGKAVVEAQA